LTPVDVAHKQSVLNKQTHAFLQSTFYGIVCVTIAWTTAVAFWEDNHAILPVFPDCSDVQLAGAGER
jgi:hypothetical protein